MSPPIAILLVDDHPVVTEALMDWIARASDLSLAGVARSVEEASRALDQSGHGAPTVDVVICDVQLAGRAEGLYLLARYGGGGCRFVMLSSFDQPALVRRAHELGAAGYLPKSTDIDEILAAVREVAAGGSAYPDASRRALQAALRAPSERERTVIILVAEGLTNDEIGAYLGLSTKTVESHLHRLFDRYGALSRTELVTIAIRQGWLTGADLG
jgi:DNA-binding NarL/FixJ family response regulator